MISARLGGAIAAVGVAFLTGWLVNGWRLEAGIRQDKLDRQQAFDDRLSAATKQRDELAVQLRTNADTHAAELKRSQDENTALRDRVDTGAVRLRVAAKCPSAPARVPEAASAARVDDGAGAELDPAARPTYFALRAGIRACKLKVDALQGELTLRAR